MTADPFNLRCGFCGAGLLPTTLDPAPEFCDRVCTNGYAARVARHRRRRTAARGWFRDRLRWLLR